MKNLLKLSLVGLMVGNGLQAAEAFGVNDHDAAAQAPQVVGGGYLRREDVPVLLEGYRLQQEQERIVAQQRNEVAQEAVRRAAEAQRLADAQAARLAAEAEAKSWKGRARRAYNWTTSLCAPNPNEKAAIEIKCLLQHGKNTKEEVLAIAVKQWKIFSENIEKRLAGKQQKAQLMRALQAAFMAATSAAALGGTHALHGSLLASGMFALPLAYMCYEPIRDWYAGAGPQYSVKCNAEPEKDGDTTSNAQTAVSLAVDGKSDNVRNADKSLAENLACDFVKAANGDDLWRQWVKAGKNWGMALGSSALSAGTFAALVLMCANGTYPQWLTVCSAVASTSAFVFAMQQWGKLNTGSHLFNFWSNTPEFRVKSLGFKGSGK